MEISTRPHSASDAKAQSTNSSEKPKKIRHYARSGKECLDGYLFAKMARGGAAELRSNADEVNRLNVFPVPDGDTGDNMSLTMESGIAAIEPIKTDDLTEVMHTLSRGMLLGARGNSGVILSQFFAGTAVGLKNAKRADALALGTALRVGVERAYNTVVKPTEGTILTVAREAVDYAVSKTTTKTTVKSFFADLADEIGASLKRTPEILPQLKAAGVVDSGGAGLFHIINGFMRVLNGEQMPVDSGKSYADLDTPPRISTENPNGKTLYCTEALVRLSNGGTKSDIDKLRCELSVIGDSVATVLTCEMLKIHAHSTTPEKVLALAHEYGEFLNIKVENITVQKLENLQKSNESFTKQEDGALFAKKENAIVAVSIGDGISAIFKELGADKIINCEGGKNPSVGDFIDTFEQLCAKRIFVLPNNSNVFLAAKQAAEIYKKAHVTVIESKSIGTGYAALAVFDHEILDTDRQIDNVMHELAAVRDGYVSPAATDAEIDGIRIRRGDAIGIAGKRIALCRKSAFDTAFELATALLADRSHLTVFYGAGTSYKSARRLEHRIKNKLPSSEIYLYDGGQDIFPYILVAR